MNYPKKILHWISDKESSIGTRGFFEKRNPTNGQVLAKVARGQKATASRAVTVASKAHESWRLTPVVKRAEILRRATLLLAERKEELAELLVLESGRPRRDALQESEGVVEQGFFYSGEGKRFYGETVPSKQANREVKIMRQSAGLGALIAPFNSPATAIAAKVFPALLCGNAAVLKSHEDAPYLAVWFAKILKLAGLPSGVLSVVQGLGWEVGAPLAADKRIEFISFTGSAATAQAILKVAAPRMAKIAVEAGGKNPLVVADDADLDRAAAGALAGAFVDAGQRCSATSRIIVFSKVYEEFKKRFLKAVKKLKVGTGQRDDFGAIINETRLQNILRAVEGAVKRGALLLAGGTRFRDGVRAKGYFMAPTVLENVSPDDELSRNEIFGPVVVLYRVKNFEEAIKLANNSQYKLTGSIYTENMSRAREFVERYIAGVVRVNAPPHGSEHNMPFGGLGLSGNGWRESGRQALDFYSELKQVSIDYAPRQIQKN